MIERDCNIFGLSLPFGPLNISLKNYALGENPPTIRFSIIE
jgi:hypothetical protein